MAQARTVICFCKQPEPGLVKSRLAVDLDEKRAAQVYKTVLENILQNICMKDYAVALYCYPNSIHPFFEYCINNYKVSLHNQTGHDLGSRMYQAISERLDVQQPVVLIGSDCLELDCNYINNAFQALEVGNDVVFGPAWDGGYALIGVNKIDSSIFNDIAWSTDKVIRQTEKKITDLGWKHVLLPLVRDIDTLSDYEYFLKHKKFKHLFAELDKKYITSTY